jgi:hypothetical protein
MGDQTNVLLMGDALCPLKPAEQELKGILGAALILF